MRLRFTQGGNVFHPKLLKIENEKGKDLPRKKERPLLNSRIIEIDRERESERAREREGYW